MVNMESKSSFNPVQYLLADVTGYILTISPTIGAAFAVMYFFANLESLIGLFLTIALSPVIFVASFIAVVFAIRLLLPRLKAGSFPVGFHRGFIAWSMHVALNRSVEILAMRNFIFNFHTTKYLYWRALGGKISFRTTCSLTSDVCDLPLIQIDEDCTLTTGVLLSAHVFFADKLILEPIRLRRKVYVGMNTTVFCGCDIGEESYIGTNNALFRDTLPPHTRLKNNEWQKGSVEK